MTDRRPAEDLWHLSIDDLFATPAEPSRLGGPGPFVINLSTSTAPISPPPKGTFNLEGVHAYQISRTEDGRQRFRLRLGPVKTELEADAILAAVREDYPGAMTAVAAEDDLRAITVATLAAEKAKPSRPAPTAPPRRPLPRQAGKTAPVHDDLEDTHPGWNLDALLPHLSAGKGAVPATPTPVKRTGPASAGQPARARTAPPPAPKAAAAQPAPQAPARPAQPERRSAARRMSAPVRAPAPSAPPPSVAVPAPRPAVANAREIPILTEKSARPPSDLQVRSNVMAPPATRSPTATVPTPPPVLDQPLAPPVAATPSPVVIEPPAAVELVAVEAIAAEPPTAAEPPAPLAVAEAAAAEKDETQRTLVEKISAIVEVFDGEPEGHALAASAAPEPAPAPAPVPVVKARAAVAPASVNAAQTTVAAPAPPTSIEELIAREIRAAVEVPSAATRRTKLASDALETDWASILSHPVEVTESAPPGAVPAAPAEPPAVELPAAASAPTEPRGDANDATDEVPMLSIPAAPAAAVIVEPVLGASVTIPVDAPVAAPPAAVIAPEPAPDPVPAPPVAVAADDDLIVVDEENGLESLVAKNNALVESLNVRSEPGVPETQLAESVAEPAVERAPSPLPSPPPAPSTPASVEESIARKLKLLAELLPALERPEPAAAEPTGSAAQAIEQLRDEAYVDTIIDPTGSEWDAILDVSVEESAPNPVEPAPVAQTPDTTPPAVEAVVRVPDPVAPVQVAPLPEAVAPSPEPVLPTRETPPAVVEAVPPALAAAAPASESMVELAVQIDSPVENSVAPVVAALVESAPEARPEPVQPPAAEEDTSLETLVAKSNAMVDSLEARNEPARPLPAPAAAEPEKAPAPPAPAPAPLVLEVIDGPPRVLDVPLLAAPVKAAEPAPPRIVSAPLKKPVHAKHGKHGKNAKIRKPPPRPDSKAVLAAPTVDGAPAAPTLPAHMETQPLASTPKPTAPVAPALPAHMVTQPLALTPKPTPPAPKTASRQPPKVATKAPVAAPPKSPHPGSARRVEILSEPLPAVDSTQTIRSLTPLELADDQKSRWFAIQLSLAEEAFDPEHVPHLDIFDEFRLYSVAGLEQGRFMHALRLGFFESEASAQAVAGYLNCYFESPAVKRVSNAERERFAEQQKVVPRKDVGATGLHAVIELSSPRPVPETRLADLREANGVPVPEDKSLWSRLFSPLKR